MPPINQNKNIAKITFGYDGSLFCGLVKQKGKKSVEQKLLAALSRLNIKSKIIFSGRTDKGVHGIRQVCSILLPVFWIKKIQHTAQQAQQKDPLRHELNKILPKCINIKSIKLKSNFHARFDAKKRIYRYILSKNVNVFENNYIHKLDKNLNKNLIDQALPFLIGVHNFQNFCKGELEEKNKIREIYDIKFYSHKINNKKIWVFSFSANSYLRSQIRMIIDFLIKLSNKQLSLKDLQTQLNKKQISNNLVSPNGLYLTRVFY